MKIIKKLLVLSYNVSHYVMLFFRKVFKKKIGTKESAGLGKADSIESEKVIFNVDLNQEGKVVWIYQPIYRLKSSCK